MVGKASGGIWCWAGGDLALVKQKAEASKQKIHLVCVLEEGTTLEPAHSSLKELYLLVLDTMG